MFIGIDIGGTNIAAGLVGQDGKIIQKASIPTEAQKGAQFVLDGLDKVCERLIEQSGLARTEVQGIGIGVPGMMNVETGEVIFCPNVPIEHVNVTTALTAKWGVPVKINNDANCAALGEAYAGGAKEANNAIVVTLGTGVGGGIIIDKKIYSGFNGAAGEIGHIVIQLDGRPCGCGRKGCWEAYASATGLVKTTIEMMLEDRNSVMWELAEGSLDKAGGRTAFEAARRGDRAGQKAVDLYIKHLAAGVIDMINIFQPEVLCIGGGVSNEGKYLLEPLQKLVDEARYTRDVPQTVIRRAQLGNDAGIIGAAMLVI